jgi:cytochrome P450
MEDVVPQGDIVSLRTGMTQPSYVVGSPAVVQDILVTHDRSFQKGRSSSILRRTIGDGLLTTEGALHDAQRKMMLPVFYKDRIAQYAEMIVAETMQLSDRTRDRDVWSMHAQMMQLTLAIICRTMFASDIGIKREALAHAVDEAIIRTAQTLYSPLVLPFSFPTPRHVAHRKANKTLRAFVQDVLDDARARIDVYEGTLVHLLLHTTDDGGQPLTDTLICDHLMTMVIAGHETTANALVWAWYLLAAHEDVREAWHAEIDALRAAGAMDMMRQLPLTQRIVQEVLRLYPPAWMILREATEPVTMCGETFVPRSAFLICPYAMHRQERWFVDAKAFRPDRFLDQEQTWPRFAYFPFGGGSRSCIGAQFALVEAVLILATLGRRWHFVRADTRPIRADPLVSLRVAGVLSMVATRR